MTLTKNTLIKFSLTTFAALMISACGSSGGGSDNPQPQNNNAANNTQTNTPSNPPQQVQNGTGAAIVKSGDRYEDNLNIQTKTLNGYNPNKINVDGTDITIGFPGITSGSWSKINANGRHLEVCCGSYSDIRFGVSDPLDENGSGYMFYNGKPTQNMPTSGVANYVGEAIISANIDELEDKDYDTSSSKFSVNFGNKTLNGSIEIQNIQPVNINATISGNSFAGTANSASLPSSGTVEGKFYGNNAKEMAGLAQGDDKSWSAAFGAKKQ